MVGDIEVLFTSPRLVIRILIFAVVAAKIELISPSHFSSAAAAEHPANFRSFLLACRRRPLLLKKLILRFIYDHRVNGVSQRSSSSSSCAADITSRLVIISQSILLCFRLLRTILLDGKGHLRSSKATAANLLN